MTYLATIVNTGGISGINRKGADFQTYNDPHSNLSTSYLGPDRLQILHYSTSSQGAQAREPYASPVEVDSGACIIINGERDFLWPLRRINHLNLKNLLE